MDSGVVGVRANYSFVIVNLPASGMIRKLWSQTLPVGIL